MVVHLPLKTASPFQVCASFRQASALGPVLQNLPYGQLFNRKIPQPFSSGPCMIVLAKGLCSAASGRTRNCKNSRSPGICRNRRYALWERFATLHAYIAREELLKWLTSRLMVCLSRQCSSQIIEMSEVKLVKDMTVSAWPIPIRLISMCYDL
jgi:hypothetical protein